MYKVREIVGGLDHDELVKLKKDLDKGAVHFKKLIEFQIEQNEKMHESYCSTCQSRIDPYSTTNFTLIFGPDDFKKKATFCAQDCLEFFLQKIKRIKEAST